MSQVIVEFYSAVDVGDMSLPAALPPRAEGISSSGTNQPTAETAGNRECVSITNIGDDNVWVNFGAAAAVNTGYIVQANTRRDFGNATAGQAVNVINDS